MHSLIRTVYTYKQIDISEIDFQDQTFKLHPEKETPANKTLEDSIIAIGMIHPPIIKKTSTTYQIIDGRKRLIICKNILQTPTCICLVLPEHLSEQETLQFMVQCILMEHQPTIVEQAFFFNKLCELEGEKDAATRFFSTLGLNPSTYYLKRLKKIIDLEEPIQANLHTGNIHENLTDKLFMLNFRDRMAIHELINELKLGTGKQKKLVIICQEIADRRHCSIADILAGQEVSTILKQSEGNPPQQAANLMIWLTRQQSPLLLQAEQEFNKYVDSLELPCNTTLKHSKSFERNSVSLSITFKNRDEFKSNWQKIRKFLKN